MAQRFGGKFSRDSDDVDKDAGRRKFTKAEVDPVGSRPKLLFIPPVVLVFLSINEGAIDLALGLGSAAILILAAWLLREGLRAEAAYNARRVARRPAMPRKIFASILTGIGIAGTAYLNDPSFFASLIFGVIASVLHLAAFGPDPLTDKGAEGIDQFQQDRVAKVVDQAEEYLYQMADAVKRAADRSVEARVERFQDQVRDMLRTVEEDPRDLTAARKFLGVYLKGARDAAVKFSDIYARSRDRGAKSDFMMLLTDLEESFDAKTRKLLLDSNTDLTVEIDVLRDRLQREGL